MTIDKKYVTIIGLHKPFLKLTTFSKKSELFKITVPEKQVDKNIVSTSYVTGHSLKEAEEVWQKKKDLFEAKHCDTTEVILYQYREETDYKNGAGVGFVFMWGVFLKLNKPVSHEYDQAREYQYFYLRGGENSRGRHVCEVWHNLDYREKKEWKEIPCTPESESFFNKCSHTLYQLHLTLMDFFINRKIKHFPKQLPFNKLL